MLGTLLSMAGFDLKRQVRSVVMTAIFAVVGAILIVLALAFGIAALYEWLKLYYGTLPALGILGGSWAVLAIVFFCLAFLRPKGRSRRVAAVNPLREPAAAIVQATEQAVDDATNLVRQGSRKQIFGALVVAVLTGFLIGRRF
jgi:hypothetical protein